MVAGKSTPETPTTFASHVTEALEKNNTSNSDTVSQINSSSDESLKSKEDDNSQDDLSISSVNIGEQKASNDETKKLNTTYSCHVPHDRGDCAGKSELDTEFLKSILYAIESKVTSSTKCTPRKRRNVLSLPASFDETDWNLESNSKTELESLSMNESSLEDEKDRSLLVRVRNYLANVQELRGTSRDQYAYCSLMKVMGQSTGRCLLALCYAFLNIAPIFEVFLFILRFVFDKLIDLKATADVQQIFVKIIVFLVQLVTIYFCLICIFGFIIVPFTRMAFGILSKLMLYD